ncbi:SET domain-containing protein 4 [Aethina tumida]|uniref:SET domain-containing protein 4 n=1 Tax=Aethina tumida TaxID=116153 RepID=UPI00214727F5|nr:SET domain-containing protein 4 [Aethina tumida]
MGRTERKRKRKHYIEKLDSDPAIIALKKWLKSNNWMNDTKLTLKNFPNTGRGVASLNNFKNNDIIICVPFHLMITLNTVLNSNILKHILFSQTEINLCQIKMQDLLSLFLITHKNDSVWKSYINSLPDEPPPLPWLCDEEDLKMVPNDIQNILKKYIEICDESYQRLKQILKNDIEIEFKEFRWAYCMVNSRAVFVNPQIILSLTKYKSNILLDDPSMALCPYLDMFNHDFEAGTEAELVEVNGKYFYSLKTLFDYKKNEQVFISYGPHDNLKLLMEYGFFIPGNKFDVVKFSFSEVTEVLQLVLDGRQYKFVKEHGLTEELYIGYSGISFNLKGLIFVGQNCQLKNYNCIIYSDSYPDDFSTSLRRFRNVLLEFKLSMFERDMLNFNCMLIKNVYIKNLEDYLRYRISFIKELIKK